MSTRQLDLPAEQEQYLPLHGASVSYYPGFFPNEIADGYRAGMIEYLDWQQLPIVLFGKRMLQPRLIAWFGDPGVRYSYSGNHFEATGWIEPLGQIRRALQQRLGISFNAVLCNRYRDGRDSMGWHSDDEHELGAQPVIASVSFGAVRQFRLREKGNTSRSVKMELGHGSVLVMAGDTQKNWQHCLPRTKNACAERINLTFRSLPAPCNQ